MAALNWPVGGLLAARAPGLVLLLLAQLAGLWGALGRERSRWAGVSWLAAASGLALVLATRGAAGTDGPGWICSISQLGAGLAPLGLVLSGLRESAFSWRRAISAGVAVGTTAIIWGEMACQRIALHVVVHHGGAFLLLLALCLCSSRALSRHPARATR